MTALTPGDPVPWFSVPSTSNPTYYFDTTGGYRTVLFFFGSSKHPQTAAVLQEFCDRQSQFALLNVPFFGISIDPDDVGLASMIQYPTYCKFLWDFDQQVSTLFGVCQKSEDGTLYAPTTFVVDERLRVLKIFPWEPDCLIHPVEQVMEFLQTLPALSPHQMAARQAPVLMIPQVLEPELCRTLIDRFEADGGRDSGFMQEHEGKTVEVMDYGFKKRRDFNLENAEDDILQRINQLVIQRVKPEIERAFQFSITRFERYLVACYDHQSQHA
jgi:peroxiredoxin